MASSSLSSQAMTIKECRILYDAASIKTGSLYNEIDRLRRIMRVSIFLGLGSVGVGSVCRHYYTNSIHRVWRLRNPHMVRNLLIGQIMSGIGALVSFTVITFPSPIGVPDRLEVIASRISELDTLGYRALELEETIRLREKAYGEVKIDLHKGDLADISALQKRIMDV